MLTWPTKDPDEVLDYSIDWTDVLALDEDTIESVTWTIPDGLTLDNQDVNEGLATAWISGGVVNTPYSIGCRMVTEGGRTYDRTIQLGVAQL